MLSIEECRKLLDSKSELTDEQIVELRQALYTLADVALDVYFKQKG